MIHVPPNSYGSSNCVAKFKLADGRMVEVSSLWFDFIAGTREAVLPDGTRAPLA